MKSRNEAPSVKLSTVATFPKNYFLENLAVRSDNSVLVTVLNHNELWYVPSSNHEQPEEPQLLWGFRATKALVDFQALGVPTLH